MWKLIKSSSDVDNDGAKLALQGLRPYEGLAKRGLSTKQSIRSAHEAAHSSALLSILDALHGSGSNIPSREWWKRAGRIGSLAKPHWGSMASRTGGLTVVVHFLEEPMILMAKGFVFATHSFEFMIHNAQLFLCLSACSDRIL